MVVDADLRTADEGRDGGLSFFCGLVDSLPVKIRNDFVSVLFYSAFKLTDLNLRKI